MHLLTEGFLEQEGKQRPRDVGLEGIKLEEQSGLFFFAALLSRG